MWMSEAESLAGVADAVGVSVLRLLRDDALREEFVALDVSVLRPAYYAAAVPPPECPRRPVARRRAMGGLRPCAFQVDGPAPGMAMRAREATA